MSRSNLEESNKTRFIIFGAIPEFLWILQDCRNINPKKTLAKSLGAPGFPHPQALTGGARWPAAHRPESRPTRGLDPRWGAATARARRAVRADTACAAAPADGGVTRRGEVGPELGKGRAHGGKEVAASLTGGLDGGERRRGGDATSRGGGEWRALAGGTAGGKRGSS